MEREHEEAMRREFAEQAELERGARQAGVTETRIEEIYRQSGEYDQRWLSGPHAEHWQYLSDAYRDCQERPDTMRRFLDNIAHNRAHGYDGDVTDTEHRSLLQAYDLAEAERPRPRPQRRR